MMRVPRSSVIVFFFLFSLWLPASARGQNGGTREAVEGLHSTLIEVMKEGRRLGYNGRYERLAPVVEKSFDLDFIARITVGRYWKGLDETQKEMFASAFGRLSVATYASRFDDYSGEFFGFVAERELSGGRRLVRTDFTKSGGEAIRFDYVLHNNGQGWSIINVVVDGVSDLSLKRAQYTSIMGDGGFDALMAKIKEKIRDYESGGENE